jgi:hypothetical protein
VPKATTLKPTKVVAFEIVIPDWVKSSIAIYSAPSVTRNPPIDTYSKQIQLII